MYTKPFDNNVVQNFRKTQTKRIRRRKRKAHKSESYLQNISQSQHRTIGHLLFQIHNNAYVTDLTDLPSMLMFTTMTCTAHSLTLMSYESNFVEKHNQSRTITKKKFITSHHVTLLSMFGEYRTMEHVWLKVISVQLDMGPKTRDILISIRHSFMTCCSNSFTFLLILRLMLEY